MIAIIHTGLGNFQSVSNAFAALGQETLITHRAEDLRKARSLVLPGVGSFGHGMARLKELGFVDLLSEEVLKKKKPILGICLGMQLMSQKGFEGGEFKGLGWVPGTVELLDTQAGALRLPHVGWNELEPRSGSRLFKGIAPGANFYFTHSYCFKPTTTVSVSALCQYGQSFVSAIESDNIAAVQFHPEKSQDVGLKLLKNFLENF